MSQTPDASFVEKLDHLFICPVDWSKTMGFWRDALRLRTLQDWSSSTYRGASLALGESRVTIAEPERERDAELGFPVEHGRSYVYLQVRDLELAERNLRRLGHPIITPPTRLHWGPRMLTTRDPDGIPVMLIEWAKAP